MSPTTQADEMTLSLVYPWLAVDGLALLTIAACILVLRWRSGRLGATLFALGLLPLAIKRLLRGGHDAWIWFVSGPQDPPEWLWSMMSALHTLDLTSPGLMLSASVAMTWAFRLRRASNRHSAG